MINFLKIIFICIKIIHIKFNKFNEIGINLHFLYFYIYKQNLIIDIKKIKKKYLPMGPKIHKRFMYK